MSISFYVSVRICVHFQKEKYTLGAKRQPLLGAKRPCAWAFYPKVLSVWILPQACDYCGNDIQNSTYMSDMDMRLIFLQILIESLASIHDIIPRICGQCFEIRRYCGVRRPRGYCPALILLPYLTTCRNAHFEIDTFTHNHHDGYVQFSTNLIQKRLSYQNDRLFFINLRPSVHSHLIRLCVFSIVFCPIDLSYLNEEVSYIDSGESEKTKNENRMQ